MEVFRFLTYALAVFRVTHMLWYENGPWDIFDWLRARVGIKYVEVSIKYTDTEGMVWPAFGNPKVVTEGFFAELLNCPWCLSVWLSVVGTIAYKLRQPILDTMALCLAMSAIPLLLFGWKKYADAG